MMSATRGVFAAMGISLLFSAAGHAQPAPTDWSCTGWRQVEMTMLNPFGRECVQWTATAAANLRQMVPPPIAAARAVKPAAAKTRPPESNSKKKRKQRR